MYAVVIAIVILGLIWWQSKKLAVVAGKLGTTTATSATIARYKANPNSPEFAALPLADVATLAAAAGAPLPDTVITAQTTGVIPQGAQGAAIEAALMAGAPTAGAIPPPIAGVIYTQAQIAQYQAMLARQQQYISQGLTPGVLAFGPTGWYLAGAPGQVP